LLPDSEAQTIRAIDEAWNHAPSMPRPCPVHAPSMPHEPPVAR
jgi:hypothetical protein